MAFNMRGAVMRAKTSLALAVISATLFLIFGSLFSGGVVSLGAYWPALLIFFGLLLLIEAIFGRQRRSAPQ